MKYFMGSLNTSKNTFYLKKNPKPECGWPLAEHPKLAGENQNSSFQEFVA